MAFLALQVLLFGAAVAVFYRPYGEQYLPVSIAKHARLAQAPSPRVIFVGASNLPFTLNSELIEQATGYHPVNMGLGRALGVEFNLAEVKPYLRRGDVVVLSFPYEWFSADDKPDIDVVLRTLEIQPSLLWKMSWLDLARIFQRDWVFEYIGRVVRVSVRTAAGRPPPEVVTPGEVWNRFGDMVAHWSRPLPERRNLTLTFGPEFSRRTSDVIRRFLHFVAARGGHVFYLFPAIPEEIFTDPQKRDFIERVEAELTDALGIRTLNRPDEVVMPSDRFFDTAYHLIGPAVQTHSARVAARLRAALSSLSGRDPGRSGPTRDTEPGDRLPGRGQPDIRAPGTAAIGP
jgi:hypothetical protein